MQIWVTMTIKNMYHVSRYIVYCKIWKVYYSTQRRTQSRLTDKDVMARSDRHNRRYMKEENSWASCIEEVSASVMSLLRYIQYILPRPIHADLLPDIIYYSGDSWGVYIKVPWPSLWLMVQILMTDICLHDK